MKRKIISINRVLMMVLTLDSTMPSFTANNRVDRVVSVTSDGNTLTNSPNLLIDADGKNDISAQHLEVFRVELTDGADWGANAKIRITI